MKQIALTLALALIIGLTAGCKRATAPSSPEGQSGNWKVRIVSATRGPRKDPSVYGAMTGPQLNVDLAVEYIGPEKDAPFERPTASLDSKELKFVSYSGNIIERIQGKKFNETFSYEDPGPELAGGSRQFSLKYGDVPPITFKLMEKKEANSNQ